MAISTEVRAAGVRDMRGDSSVPVLLRCRSVTGTPCIAAPRAAGQCATAATGGADAGPGAE
ncbi:unnamed protein product [Streptomyces laurentii]|uniref:Uncharacterized protein n=1 Tax=Streptomyces laurentii TaxID=39478 RepID=A0A160P3A4_STRLU|nr:unnamed protein product [Streptomyces laurentii]